MNPLSVVVVVAVVAAATGVVTANRNNDRLYSSLHELTNVLREGFNTLAGELKQERASRDDFARALKTEMLELRRGECRRASICQCRIKRSWSVSFTSLSDARVPSCSGIGSNTI